MNEIEKDEREDLFAVPPPLEAKMMLFSLGASVLGRCLDFGDVVRAYFQARVRRRVYVELPHEDFEGKHGLLRKATHGARDAGQNWELEYTEMMTEAGFRQGPFNACVCYREQKSVRVAVDGEDFTVLGPLGSGKPETVFLNRILTVTENRLEHEADQRRE